jgi:hypothetical protein
MHTHACTQSSTHPRTHGTPRCRAIEPAQLTSAWLIAAPPSNRARTHSTCPCLLAFFNGVKPFVCNTTRRPHQTSRCHAKPHHRIHTSAAAHYRDAPHYMKYGLGSVNPCPSPQARTITAHPTSCKHMHARDLPRILAHTAPHDVVPWSLYNPPTPGRSTRPRSTAPGHTPSARSRWRCAGACIRPTATPHGTHTENITPSCPASPPYSHVCSSPLSRCSHYMQ